MLRKMLTSRAGRAVCASSIGLASLSLTVAATTVAGAATLPKPSITNLAPTSVKTTVSSTVTITGKNLTSSGATTLIEVGTLTLAPKTKAATKLTFASPAEFSSVHTETVKVSLSKSGEATQTSTAKNLTYTTPPAPPTPPTTPSVTGVSTGGDGQAGSGLAGGVSVTITGGNFGSNSTVKFGTSTAITPTVVSGTELKATAPSSTAAGLAASTPGSADITVTNTVAGASPSTETSATSSADLFTYEGSSYLPPASLIIGSGSQTTYEMMRDLGTIFEQSPGCDLTNTTVNQLALQCSTANGSSGVSDAAGTVGGEAGLPVGDVNPLDDYYANAPGTGSGNGRSQATSATPTLLGGPAGIGAFNTSFARSSSFSLNADLNYVGYATDAVSWVSEAQHNGTPTAHANVVNISKADLVSIWAGTLGCNTDGTPDAAQGGSNDGTFVTMDWRCLQLDSSVTEGGSADPIDCYTTQTASGTYSTWQGFLGFTKNVNPPCSSAANEQGDTGDANVTTDHNNLTENQMAVVDHASDAANAIYFFSYGKFVQTCTTNIATSGGGQVQGTCIGQDSTSITQFGEINGIVADKTNIQGPGGGVGGSFPDNRILYNAYADTAAPVPATPATLNFIGAGGFLCRADMRTEMDPNSTTGLTYRTEIENAITNDGFFPLDTTQTDTFTNSSPLTLVPSMGTNYPKSSSNQSGSAAGYCIVKNN
jgi:hypothetical protein